MLPTSLLFTVRVWEEDLGGGHKQWRGQVRNLTNGEARFFTGWDGLEAVVKAMTEHPADMPPDVFRN